MDPFEGGDELTADIFHVQGRLDLIVTLPSEQHPALQSFRFTSLLSEIWSCKLGSGCSTVVENKPRDQEVTG